MPERLIVIGGDAAGMSAASEARRRRTPDDLEIVVFERSSYVSYSACGEPYYVSGDVPEVEQLLARTPAQFARLNIEVHTRREVTSIDTGAQRVTVRNVDSGDLHNEPYDQLLIATGAEPNRPPIDGAQLPGVHQMHTLDDAIAVRRLIEEEHPKTAVVIGGGYIGVEMAEAFSTQGVDVSIITSATSLLDPQFDPDMGNIVRRAVERFGIDVFTERRINRLEGDSRVTGAHCDQDNVQPAEVVLLGLGSYPEVWLASENGIPIGPTGAILVDDHQRTGVPNVWAAGDCAEDLHRISGRAANYHLGTIANKQGRIAGINIGGGDAAFPGVLGTAITSTCGIEAARTGLTEGDCERLGLDVVAARFRSTTAAGYWPGSERMTMKIVAERGSRRLLGAQIVGGAGAGKRIDAVAMALWNHMTADDLINVDLSYAPPFSGVWDPVLVAARKAQAALDA